MVTEMSHHVILTVTECGLPYEDAIHVLSTKPPKEEKKVDAATTQEDYYRNFRTKFAASLHSRYY